MKIPSPITRHKARIEVIPLIDIMFFLLAAFVLVSLTMVKQLTVEVDLPQGSEAAESQELEPVALAVDIQGGIWFGHDPVELNELRSRLDEALAEDRARPVSIAGDRDVSHGTMVEVLQFVRACGAENVGFALRPPGGGANGEAEAAIEGGGGADES